MLNIQSVLYLDNDCKVILTKHLGVHVCACMCVRMYVLCHKWVNLLLCFIVDVKADCM